MALDFQQVQQQVRQLGEQALQEAGARKERREQALQLLHARANDQERLRQKVEMLARLYDPNLRCAIPVEAESAEAEQLDAHCPVPDMPDRATILAADGSQIAPDRHAEVQYGLTNIGAVQMEYGLSHAPQTTVRSQLLYDEQLENLSEATLALKRDLAERRTLIELAAQAVPPVITLTDGPIELWGAKDADNPQSFEESLEEYKEALLGLQQINAAVAGYVDKPYANLVVRLLEIARLPEAEFANLREYHPFQGVTDLWLFKELLHPGERSAVFAIQSRSAAQYEGPLGLHFFYLNVGRAGHASLARVEIPAWVAGQPGLLEVLQSMLVSQCQLLGTRPYPYLLQRAHETAVVTLPEKEQVTQMIALELRRRGVEVGEVSNKQANKEQAHRTRYGQ